MGDKTGDRSYRLVIGDLRHARGRMVLLVLCAVVLSGGIVAFLRRLEMPWDAIPGVWLMPVAMVLFGVVPLLYNARLTVDLQSQTFTLRQGWPLLRRNRTWALEELSQLYIRKEIRHQGSSGASRSSTTFPVDLVPRKRDEKPVRLCEFKGYPRSRAFAEQVAKFAQLDLADSSGGTLLVRRAEHLDETVLERLQRTGRRMGSPELPENTKLVHRLDEQALTVRVPTPLNVRLLSLAPVGGAVIFATFIIAITGSWYDMELFRLLSPFALGPLVVTGVWSMTLYERYVELYATPHGVVKRKAWLLWVSRCTIPMGDIEELRRISHVHDANPVFTMLGYREALLIRSDQDTMSFGLGLKRVELEWIQAEIEALVLVSET